MGDVVDSFLDIFREVGNIACETIQSIVEGAGDVIDSLVETFEKRTE